MGLQKIHGIERDVQVIMNGNKVSICKAAVIISLHLTLRRLMSYIYGAPILDVSRSHTTTQHSR